MDVNELIGLTEKEAEEVIAAKGLEVRIMQREDKYFIATMDYQIYRVNLYIVDGKVQKADIG